MPILIDVDNVTLQGADRALIENLSLTVTTGDRIGVVGINGVGKSTLLRIVAGDLEPDSGEIRRGRGVRVGFLEQIPTLPPGTVRDAVGSGWQIDAALDRVGMLGALDSDVTNLSGGELKRVTLARLFADANDVLILDEPTNHLDLNAIKWLEQQMVNFRGAVVVVSHDRFLLDEVTTRMVEIDRGKTFTHPGGYSKLLEAQADRAEAAASSEQTRRNLARTELAWLRRSARARSTKPQARVDAATRLLASRPDAPARVGSLELTGVVPRLGTTVMKSHNVAFSYDGGRQILRDVTLEFGPGDRIGIVGPNGSGKSTLVNLLAQKLAPSRGTLKFGPTVVVSYLEQGGGDFNEEATVQELVAGPDGVAGSPEDVALMKRFWFTGALPATKATQLSGGERRRLQLLLALAARPNVLIFDEPTNDLDLETIRLVEEFLGQWPGTLIVVSHDRMFLSRTTERLLEVHPDGTVADVPGGIDAWIARSRDVGASAPGKITSSAPQPDASSDAPLGRQIRDAEKEVTRLERRRTSLSQRLLAGASHEELIQLGRELRDVQSALDLAEERWLSLME